MILKASQRSGAAQLAAHLLNERDNDHVTVREVRGFVANDLRGALREAEAVARGTKCQQYLFSVSLNPPKEGQASEQDLLDAADKVGRAVGLERQPRAVIIHEKEGRRHAHVVWSRIDGDAMRAVNLPFFKRKLTALSRELYLDHGWSLPDGLRVGGGKNPLNFTLAEWQQAKRLGLDPREIKSIFRDAWARSDGLKAFRAALEERGYYLAQGDRRALVALDLQGEVFAVSRLAGVKTKELRDRLGAFDDLPSVAATREMISQRLTVQLRHFIGEAKARQASDLAPVRAAITTLRDVHRDARATLASDQATRFQAETAQRSARFRRGLLGLWDRVTGKAGTLRRQNEAEAAIGTKRDRDERDTLVARQLLQRQTLQADLDRRRRRHVQDRRVLSREVAAAMRMAQRREEQARTRSPDLSPDERRTRPRRRSGPDFTL